MRLATAESGIDPEGDSRIGAAGLLYLDGSIASHHGDVRQAYAQEGLKFLVQDGCPADGDKTRRQMLGNWPKAQATAFGEHNHLNGTKRMGAHEVF